VNRLLDAKYVKSQGLKTELKYYEEQKIELKNKVMDLRLIPSLAKHPNELLATIAELEKIEKLLAETELELDSE